VLAWRVGSRQYIAAVADLSIPCYKRGLALSLELALDLAIQRLLIGFHRQKQVGPPAP